MTGFLKCPWVLHPRKRTWNLKLSHLEKETHLKKTSIFGFHFSFWKEASFQDTGTWFDKKHTKNLLKNISGHPPTGEICRAHVGAELRSRKPIWEIDDSPKKLI